MSWEEALRGFEAFLRDFFLVAINFLRVGYPELSIYNSVEKSSK